MRRMLFRARGVAAGLGLVGVLGFGGVAAAKEPLTCHCSITNQRVEPADSCITIDMSGYCDGVVARNDCAVPVTLVDWPLKSDLCLNKTCTQQLQPGQQALFSFYDEKTPGSDTPTEASYQVKIGDGAAQTLTVSANVMCSYPEPEDEGCAAAPGALAALGVLLLTVPVARWRRRG